jgi:hypothetical protein
MDRVLKQRYTKVEQFATLFSQQLNSNQHPEVSSKANYPLNKPYNKQDGFGCYPFAHRHLRGMGVLLREGNGNGSSQEVVKLTETFADRGHVQPGSPAVFRLWWPRPGVQEPKHDWLPSQASSI